jgi:hypothetical protein
MFSHQHSIEADEYPCKTPRSDFQESSSTSPFATVCGACSCGMAQRFEETAWHSSRKTYSQLSRRRFKPREKDVRVVRPKPSREHIRPSYVSTPFCSQLRTDYKKPTMAYGTMLELLSRCLAESEPVCLGGREGGSPRTPRSLSQESLLIPKR